MSILGGILAEDGRTVSQDELRRSCVLTDRFAFGPTGFYVKGSIGMSLQPYPSHERSTMDAAPIADIQGNVVSFDGRLDNCRELAEQLELDAAAVSDSEIVICAFRRWEESCFARFTGDWAMALWSGSNRQLYLARDHAGTRTLYFAQTKNEVRWSTFLDALVRTGIHHSLSEDYAARYLAQLPMRDLTPYEGIHSVLPGHYLRIADGKISKHAHWSALIRGTIEYKSEAEYDEHFLSLFRQAVARRTGPGAPILAELSGGMDSTSIVCMSDHMRRMNDPKAEILDTISYFDDSEASFDERTYFSITEKIRGRVGAHIDIELRNRTFEPHDAAEGVYLIPGADNLTFRKERRFHGTVWLRGYRSILSGIGGDEVLGGVPTGLPELSDHLVFFRWILLFRQAVSWSMVDRSPLALTLARTAVHSSKTFQFQTVNNQKLPPWISTRFRPALHHAKKTLHLGLFSHWGAPSRLDNAMSWWSIMETLPHLFPLILSRPEYRYPYLDKDLVEYLFSIPRAQILRPGRRRFLMRRALAKIVPGEILERRRKAFQLHGPLTALREAADDLQGLFTNSAHMVQRGWVNADELRSGLNQIARGDARHWQGLLRAITLELWLRSSHHTPTLRTANPADALASISSTVP
jgi:asparagine synthase (glutamine-hydrolysing)